MTGRDRAIRGRDDAIANALDPDVGPVDGRDCSANCPIGGDDERAVYSVPLPTGGDAAFCPYHLAWFLRQYPDIRDRLVDADDDVAPDPRPYAASAGRFVDLDDAPRPTMPDPVDPDRDVRPVGLLQNGRVLYESTEPDDDGNVRYVEVGTDLEAAGGGEVHRSNAGDALRSIRRNVGFIDLEPGVRVALSGGHPDDEGEPFDPDIVDVSGGGDGE